MSDKPAGVLEAPNELVRWLRMLALPLWARAGVLLLVCAILLGAAALLGHGLWSRSAEQVSGAITLLTVSLPVLLIVIALVFGQNSDRRLRDLTRSVLEQEVPRAVRENLAAHAQQEPLSVALRGCSADYCLDTRVPGASPLRFSVELNVYKVNVCFWLDGVELPHKIDAQLPALVHWRHVVVGALAEGYRLNEVPAQYSDARHGQGLLFFRSFHPEFLLHAEQRLYFAQDLAFFVRGVLEAQRSAAPRAVAA